MKTETGNGEQGTGNAAGYRAANVMNLHRVIDALGVDLAHGIAVATSREGSTKARAMGDVVITLMGAWSRHPEWAHEVVEACLYRGSTPQERQVMDRALEERFEVLRKRVPIQLPEISRAHISGGAEYLHGVGHGLLDEEEGGDGAHEGAVRRAQPETAAAFDAHDSDARPAPQDSPGEPAADEGGDVA